MAAPLRKTRQDEVRQKIQASQLINRLQAHADGKVEMSATQVRAAQILLDKSIPNLVATEISGDADNPLLNEITLRIVDVPGRGDT